MTSIYAIVNKINNKIYIGSSTNTIKRWNRHKHRLRNGTHHSIHLQRAWDKDGEENFSFIIVEEIESKDLLEQQEQFWMDYYNSYNDNFGYNIATKAKHSRIDIIQPEHVKEKISQGLLKYYSENETSDSKRQKISERMKEITKGSGNSNARLSDDDVAQIKNLLSEGHTNASIARRFNVSRSNISHIKTGRKWSHII